MSQVNKNTERVEKVARKERQVMRGIEKEARREGRKERREAEKTNLEN